MTSPSFDHETFLSPLTWRYGSPEMRALWSEAERRRRWRAVWHAVAVGQANAGLVPEAAAATIGRHTGEVDIAAAEAIEAEIHHDLMAELRVFADQCDADKSDADKSDAGNSGAGGWLHLGCTSMDIEDNADALRIRDGMALVVSRLETLMTVLAHRIDATADDATMAFTHLQPAEPTTTGYRLAQLGWDLLVDHGDLVRLRDDVRGKGLKGAVGTAASFGELLRGGGAHAGTTTTTTTTTTTRMLEDDVMAQLGIAAMPVATQTYARKQDLRVLSGLSTLGQSLYRFAADLRLLQAPTIGEWSEPFAARQVGSSAMPFKRNPIHAENIDSLMRMLAALPRVAWDNAAHCYLERTLDDSANRRMILPSAFLLIDEALKRATRLCREMVIHRAAAERLLDTYGVFAATERVLMALSLRGGDRQALHEILREHSLAAWPSVAAGTPNPLADLLAKDPRLLALADAETIYGLLDARGYVGDAPERARALAADMRAAVSTSTFPPTTQSSTTEA